MIRTAILLAAVFIASAAHADEQCKLQQLGSFDLKQLPNGALSIPVMIAGKQQMMEIDISDPYSYLYADYGDAEKFSTKKLPSNVVINVNHQASKETYTVPSLTIGNAGGKDLDFLRVDSVHKAGGEAIGEIALDLLAGFDIELDMQNGKMNLFSQDHCLGKVVYWAKTYAQVPFRADASGHVSSKMTLDGKEITVALDLSPRHGLMGMKTANRIFGLDKDSPGMSRIEDAAADAPAIYNYPFKSLSMEGVSINNPKIVLYEQSRECRSNLRIGEDTRFYRCFGASDLNIGLGEVSQLHIYFAFKEKMLYVTAANAH